MTEDKKGNSFHNLIQNKSANDKSPKNIDDDNQYLLVGDSQLDESDYKNNLSIKPKKEDHNVEQPSNLSKKKSVLRQIFWFFSFFMFSGIVVAIIIITLFLFNLNSHLPDYNQLKDYAPPVTTRIYAGDGSLVAEYARERRIYMPFDAIPKRVIEAFISAEDKNFFQHHGIYYQGIPRALLRNIKLIKKGRSLQGASTITQQVAKNFLLSNEQTVIRKLKEALLAIRIEKAMSKEKILELYLNEIYMGNRSYGIAASALNYFEKPLIELSLEEIAYLAAIPKGPANYHPIKYNKRAVNRRNWVINRMYDNGFITKEEKEYAKAQPLKAKIAGALGARTEYFGHFAEEVRKEISTSYGKEALYDGGLSVRTTVDPILQSYAVNALRYGLQLYDVRHGFRGALNNISTEDVVNKIDNIVTKLKKEYSFPSDLEQWHLAVVTATKKNQATILLDNKITAKLPFIGMQWAKKYKNVNHQGATPKSVHDILNIGDVVFVCKDKVFVVKDKKLLDDEFALCQVPSVNGAIVALDPHTGRVYAMIGGFSYYLSQFNRATQAKRQPGSTFKPFVYSAALDNGYTPSSLVLDAPFTATKASGWWKPGNYVKGRYKGLTTLRQGIEHSRNTMTVRLANKLGLDRVIRYVNKFAVSDKLPRELAIALGVKETTLIDISKAYASFVNGGKKITPFMIDKIQDREGVIIYNWNLQSCKKCNFPLEKTSQANLGGNYGDFDFSKPPKLSEWRKQIINPLTAYQIVHMLEGVVKHGSGRIIGKIVKNPLAGKTGTTNDYKDAWFIGFSPDLVVGVFVGFDNPSSLGVGESGGSVAAPIFAEMMKNALKDVAPTPFRRPSGIILARVDPKTGSRTTKNNFILEAFKPGDKIPSSSDVDNLFSFDNSVDEFWDDLSNSKQDEIKEENKNIDDLTDVDDQDKQKTIANEINL